MVALLEADGVLDEVLDVLALLEVLETVDSSICPCKFDGVSITMRLVCSM